MISSCCHMRSRVLPAEIHGDKDVAAMGLIVTLPEKSRATGDDCKQLGTLQVRGRSLVTIEDHRSLLAR
jgi:hypothetical protein